jgi:hypothetical protein
MPTGDNAFAAQRFNAAALRRKDRFRTRPVVYRRDGGARMVQMMKWRAENAGTTNHR